MLPVVYSVLFSTLMTAPASGLQAASGEDAATAPVGAEGDETDVTPPVIEDFAVASGNWGTAPRVTAVLSDDLSGVDTAILYYRRTSEDTFEQATLYPGSGGLFMAVLPDGLQQTGFQYYCQVTDAAGNVSFLGGPGRAYDVPAARQYKAPPPPKVEKQPGDDDEQFAISPIWVFLPGAGAVIATAISGVAFGVAYVSYATNLSKTNLSEERRRAYELNIIGDVVIGAAAGVVALAGFGTAGGIIIYNALNPVE